MSQGQDATGALRRPWLQRLPPNLFAIPLGLLGLAGAWRSLVPTGITLGNPISLRLFLVGVGIFLLLLVLWIAKLLRHFATVRDECRHPIHASLTALMPLSLMVAVAQAAPAFPLPPELWLGLVLAALAFQAWLAWQVVAPLAAGQVAPELLTPALYLPTVGGGFVGGIALHALEYGGWAALLFGMGLGAWALLEIRILNRLFAGPLPPALRATLGLEIAPAAVGSLAVATLWPAFPAEGLLVCLGIASAPVFAVLTRWRQLTEVPFTAGWWSLSFPLAAMAGTSVEAVRRGGWSSGVALAALVIASAGVAYLALRTLWLLARGRLLPPV